MVLIKWVACIKKKKIIKKKIKINFKDENGKNL